MMQASLFDVTPHIFSVSEINTYLRRKFEADVNLQDVWLEGEISNWKQSASGHIYFTLKDAKAAIRCVIWRSTANLLFYKPQQDGEAVLAHGRISVYEAGGSYQFYVDDLEPAGQGKLYAQFEQIKARLAAEGLFEAELKQPIPAFPRCIGIVTSPDAAALRDILNVLRRRYPTAHVILSPTQVQGDSAPGQIAAALRRVAQQPVDVIILSRGGGSLEDLWAFNDETLARAVAACPIPVIAGVGHETDFTIVDFVADLRAPTPSAAAEIVSPNQVDLKRDLIAQQAALTEAVQRNLTQARNEVRQLTWALERLSPQTQINAFRQQIDGVIDTVTRTMQHRLALWRQQVNSTTAQLKTLNPQATLERGYAIIHKDQTVVTQIDQVQNGELIVVNVTDGQFDAVVKQSST